MTHEEFAEKHPHPPSPFYVKINRPHKPALDRQRETDIDRPPSLPIDRRTPLTYRVRLPSIDNDRINALRPLPKPLPNPPEPTTNPSDTTLKPMQVDETTEGRRLRKRKEKIPKNLKREANEKEMDGFTKRVLRIPVEKPFDKVYFTHQLWMFFRETKETEEDIRRMFHHVREMMKLRITLKKKSDPGKFAIPCVVKGIEFPHALCDTGASVSILPKVMADQLDDDFLQVVKHEKLGEGDFDVESSMSFSGSHWNSQKNPHPPSPFYVKIDRPHEPTVDRQRETDIDRPPSHPIDRWEPLTYRVRLPSIDNDRMNALRPPPKPLAKPPEPTTNPSDTTPAPMQVDEATEGRRLRKRKEKIPKNLKREANEKEMDGFTKRVLRIPVEKPFDEVYFTHRLWMFFRETKETEEDIRKMFHHVRERMKLRITLKKKSDPGKFAIPCVVKDNLSRHRDESGYAMSVAGEMIPVTKDNIRKIPERASLFEESHICLPEHATSFTPTKLAPEIYTKDGYNELFRGMAKMMTEIDSMQHNLEKEAMTSPSIDANKAKSINVKPQTSQIPAEPESLAEKKDEWEIAYINTGINDVYNPLKNNEDWLSTRFDLLQQDLDTIRKKDP
ncbi:hypothetical protein F2Q70_00012109 [Brassica cretica]|uniref:Uncharacterized protein n=1 Tax=Brassica cretica TaxID=69181 RepID=A0A8S9LQT3_BRACR|nr:hypothetical protein F2Q70_00012109 [Brassica cretica]